MKFIFIFFLLINTAHALNELKDCLEKGNLIGRQRLAAADTILLVPGTGTRGTILTIGHFGNLGGYFQQIENLLDDHKINFVTVPADPKGNDSVEERARKLRRWIRRYGLEGRRVLVIGHSLGGLVARVAARDLTLRNYISAVVTISSPNRGDYLVDWLDEDHYRNDLLHQISRIVGFDMQKKRFFFQMKVSYAHNYNMAIDHSKLLPPIFSVVTYQTPEQLSKSFIPFRLTDEIIRSEMNKHQESGGPWKTLTDGFAPAYSQVWGECLGMINANHATILGKTYYPKTLKEIKSTWLKLLDIFVQRGILKK